MGRTTPAAGGLGLQARSQQTNPNQFLVSESQQRLAIAGGELIEPAALGQAAQRSQSRAAAVTMARLLTIELVGAEQDDPPR